MAIAIRRAQLEDAEAIATVHVETWQAAYRELLPDDLLDGMSVTQQTEHWRLYLGSEDGPTVLVALDGDAVIGFCAVERPSRDEDAGDDVAELGGLYVLPGSWRAGAGRALMDAALDGLRETGVAAVTLWVLAENERALGFYARYAFEADGATQTEPHSGREEIRLRLSLPG